MKIWDFPTLSIKEQLFYVPGMAYEGGYTSGGVRILSPEPGGRAILEIRLGLQVKEFQNPWSSWIASKINGEIFRVRLTNTPQLVPRTNYQTTNSYFSKGIPWNLEGSLSNASQNWDNEKEWNDDTAIEATSIALEGQVFLRFNVLTIGSILKPGHLIGHQDYTYCIEEIEYAENEAIATIIPPLRKNIAVGDLVLLTPYFLGNIANGSEIRNNYESQNVGHIQLNRIVFQEAII